MPILEPANGARQTAQTSASRASSAPVQSSASAKAHGIQSSRWCTSRRTSCSSCRPTSVRIFPSPIIRCLPNSAFQCSGSKRCPCFPAVGVRFSPKFQVRSSGLAWHYFAPLGRVNAQHGIRQGLEGARRPPGAPWRLRGRLVSGVGEHSCSISASSGREGLTEPLADVSTSYLRGTYVARCKRDSRCSTSRVCNFASRTHSS